MCKCLHVALSVCVCVTVFVLIYLFSLSPSTTRSLMKLIHTFHVCMLIHQSILSESTVTLQMIIPSLSLSQSCLWVCKFISHCASERRNLQEQNQQLAVDKLLPSSPFVLFSSHFSLHCLHCTISRLTDCLVCERFTMRLWACECLSLSATCVTVSQINMKKYSLVTRLQRREGERERNGIQCEIRLIMAAERRK